MVISQITTGDCRNTRNVAQDAQDVLIRWGSRTQTNRRIELFFKVLKPVEFSAFICRVTNVASKDSSILGLVLVAVYWQQRTHSNDNIGRSARVEREVGVTDYMRAQRERWKD